MPKYIVTFLSVVEVEIDTKKKEDAEKMAMEAWNRDPAAYVATTHNETYVTRSRGNLTFQQRLASLLSGVYKKLFFGKGVN